MSIEQAAAAFDADMGRSTSTVVKDPRPAPAEPIFSNLGNMEVDDDSPARGGGDDAPTAEELAARARQSKSKTPPKDEDDDSNFTDEELEALGLPPRDPDEEFEEDKDDNGDENREDDDGDDGDDDEILAKTFTVMVDGEETQVSLKDALQNFSHREAVDRRMNFVEQARQAVVQEAENVVKSRQDIDAKLEEAEAILQALLPTEPNWDDLFTKNPAEARALQKQYEQFQGKIKEIREKRQKNAQEAQEHDLTNTVKYRNAEAKRFASIAKWDNAKSRDKDLASMQRTALSAGFTQQEVAQVLDSRMLHILLKASKYDRMMAARPKPAEVRQQQRPANPGAGRNRTAPKGNDRAMKNLQRTGSVEDAASVFAGILKRSNR